MLYTPSHGKQPEDDIMEKVKVGFDSLSTFLERYMKGLHMVSFILLVVGGLNWGIFGVTSLLGGSWEVGSLLGGMDGAVAGILYVIVGLAAVAELVTHKKTCSQCQKGSGSGSMGGSQSGM